MRLVLSLIPVLLLLIAPTAASQLAAQRQGAAALPRERFDNKVRDDFFTGFGGDAKALERAMTACEATLKKQPDHPEALVWHGCGATFQAGRAFQKGDYTLGMDLWQKGMTEMDRAVKLAPEDIAVRIPRATCLIPASRNVPAAQRHALLARAREDLEMVYRVQKPVLARLSGHSRGELLMGLAEVYKRLGEEEKARAILEQVKLTCTSTPPYVEEANRWLKTPATPEMKFYHTCIGCHE
jgi:tetratricopeptide (TPR) repeat protein